MFTSESLSQAYKATQVQQDAEGEWVPCRTACNILGVSKTTLLDWKEGIPWLRGEKLRHKPFKDANGKHDYYLKGQLERTVAARAAAADTDWIIVDEVSHRFNWSERTLYRWLAVGCPDLDGEKPRSEIRRVQIRDKDGREQSTKKLHLYVPELVHISNAQAAKKTMTVSGRISSKEAMSRMGCTDRQQLRRRIRRHNLDVVTRVVRKSYRTKAGTSKTRPISDAFLLPQEVDAVPVNPTGVSVDGHGERWWSRKAALAERGPGKKFPNLTPRVLQYYPNKPCPALDYDVLHARKRPRPAGRGGRHPSTYEFLENDLLRLKPPDATKREDRSASRALATGPSSANGENPAKRAAKARWEGESNSGEQPAIAAEPTRLEPNHEAEADYPGHIKKPYCTGPKPIPDRESVLKFCYDYSRTHTRKETLAAAKERFGPSAPKDTDGVKRFSQEWSNRFVPPLPRDRGGQLTGGATNSPRSSTSA